MSHANFLYDELILRTSTNISLSFMQNQRDNGLINTKLKFTQWLSLKFSELNMKHADEVPSMYGISAHF
jgi:hypothetical protein